jgi:hypothetical protein
MRKQERFYSIFLAALMLLMAAPAYASTNVVSQPSSGCVRAVPSESIIDPYSNRVLLPNGTIMNSNSISCSPGMVASTTGNTAYGPMTIPSSDYYTNYQNFWTVPAAPSNGGFSPGMADAFWNGPGIGGGDVVQPILIYGCIQWNWFNQCTEGSNTAWSIFDMAIVGSNKWISNNIAVSKGDNIVGTVIRDSSLTFCSGNGPGYSIGAGDSTIGSTNTLIVCDTDLYHVAMAGSLEVKSLSTCNQLPDVASDSFSSITYSTSPTGAGVTYSTGQDVLFCSAAASWNSGDTALTINWST